MSPYALVDEAPFRQFDDGTFLLEWLQVMLANENVRCLHHAYLMVFSRYGRTSQQQTTGQDQRHSKTGVHG